MRILLDECVPKKLKRHLTPHRTETVREMGWAGTKNGSLLRLIAAETFDIFITVDKKMRSQQNVLNMNFAILVLIAPSTRIKDLLPLLPSIHSSLDLAKPGDVVEIRR